MNLLPLAIQQATVTQIKTVLMLVFFVAFCGLLVWLGTRKAGAFQQAERLPLDNDE